MRLAYVAQHAFHHIEHHLEKTPVNYLEWRFSGGMDREGQAKNFLELTEDEEKLVGQKQGQVEKLIGRRKGKKGHEYEVQYVGCQNPIEDNSWVLKDVLLRMKWTNFLDRDSLGALATAIKNYAGGCIIISHQREFYSAPCPEVWSVVDGRCTVSGSEWMDAAEKARKKAEKEAAKTASLTKEDKFDAFGNKIEEKQAAKKIPKSELKKIKKRVADMRKKGQEVWTDEEIEKDGWEVPLPRDNVMSPTGTAAAWSVGRWPVVYDLLK